MEGYSVEVDRLLAEGDAFVNNGLWEAALQCYRAAWDALPEPKEANEQALSTLAAIADTHFFNGDWEECRVAAQQAAKISGGLENPFIRLRLGQSLFELGDLREAANWMVPAYLLEGKKLFEDEDPKYLDFLKAQLEPPPNGWPEGW